MEQKYRRKHIRSLTGLRGLAALWVLSHHLSWLFFIPRYSSLADQGWLGVDLFFVLSGFVISYVHQDHFRTISGSNLKRYLALRVGRVYPVVVATLLLWIPAAFVYLRMSGDHGGDHPYTLPKFLYSLFLLNGWGFPGSDGWNTPSWSVSSEMFAYFCFPAIALLLGRIRRRSAHLWIIVVVMTLSISLSGLLTGFSKYMLDFESVIYRVLSEFLMGAALFNVYRLSDSHEGSAVHDAGAIICTAVVVFLPFFRLPALYDFLMIVAFVGLVYFCASAPERGIASRLFGNKPVVYLGKISYSLYMIHALILVSVSNAAEIVLPEPGFAGGAAIVAAVVGMVILAAHLLFKYLEDPVRLMVRDRISPKK